SQPCSSAAPRALSCSASRRPTRSCSHPRSPCSACSRSLPATSRRCAPRASIRSARSATSDPWAGGPPGRQPPASRFGRGCAVLAASIDVIRKHSYLLACCTALAVTGCGGRVPLPDLEPGAIGDTTGLVERGEYVV